MSPLPLAALVLVAAPQDLSVHVPAADGTRLAVDVHLPEDRGADGRVPALLELTRYWRGREDARTGARLSRLDGLDRTFLEHGYALVKVDVRGTGASFGTRPIEYGPQEVRDGRDVVDWVVAQDWCDGNVGAYGTSYSGTTAELLAATEHPALKAVIPGWSDFDVYESPARPYGLYATQLIDTWGRMVGWMDDNVSGRLGGAVPRVDGDTDGALRTAAVAEHRANVDVGAAAGRGEFRDDPWVAGGPTWAEASSRHWKAAIERSGVPMLVFASWLDAGTAAGALERFATYSNPQHLVLLASSHGGGFHASPFVVEDAPWPSNPPPADQIAWRLAFFDHWLKGAESGVAAWPKVRYFTLGAEDIRASDTWPPEDVARRRFHAGAEGSLTTAPDDGRGSETYRVDFRASTGRANRWATQLGGPVLGLHDRGDEEAGLLAFETEPFEEPIELTGTASLHLTLTSSHPDVAVLAYLSVVDLEGRSRYLTEGGLRSIHRKLATGSDVDAGRLRRTYARADALPLVPGEPAALELAFWPTSVVIPAGSSLRLSIAGADAATFARLPASGEVTFEVTWGGGATWLDVPLR